MSSQSRARAEPCRQLGVRHERKCRLGDSGAVLLFPVESRSDEVALPDPAPKSSANLNGWKARKTFDNL